MKERDLWKRYRRKKRIIVGISVVILVLLYTFKNVSFLIRSLSTVGLLFLFYLIDHFFDLDFETRHYLFVALIAVTSFLLSPLYFIYPQYDKIQHLLLPIAGASVVFHVIDLLNLRMKWKIVFLFFIMVGYSGLFELSEYWLDYFFDLKLQGVFLRDLQGLQRFDILLDRIDDTMIDMSLGVVGTLVYAGYRALFLRKKKTTRRRKPAS